MARQSAFIRCLCLILIAGGTIPALGDLVEIETGTSFEIYLNTDNFDPVAYCHGSTPGATWLRPIEYLSYGSPEMSAVTQALWAQYSVYYEYVGDPNEPRPPDWPPWLGWPPAWTYANNFHLTGQTLPGTLVIDSYGAVDEETDGMCTHGAGISVSFDYTGDPLFFDAEFFRRMGLQLGWITVAADWADHPDSITSAASFVPWSSSMYPTNPSVTHPDDEPFAYDGVYYTVLAGTTDWYYFFQDRYPFLLYRDIVIYEGFVWGYEAQCIVPEPASGLLLMLGVGAIAARRKVGKRIHAFIRT